jgi:opacity protein-like surface antigen
MRLLCLLFFLCPLVTLSQTRLHADIFTGFGNYYGDLQNKPITLDQSSLAIGAGVKYDWDDHLAFRTGFMYGKIGADDKRNKPSLQLRNLNFQSKIFEWNFIGEYTLFDLHTRQFSPYGFAGLAIFHFNPYTFDSLGVKYFLRPLSTEGEGLAAYPDRKPYHLTQLSIPFGVGVKFRVTNNVVIAYEFGLRKTFTDHLDDVSTTYVDQNILLNAKGAKAVELAYRGDEIKNGDANYPADGSIRGGAKYKDWYYFSGVRISIALNTPNKFFNRPGKSSLDCPVKVY